MENSIKKNQGKETDQDSTDPDSLSLSLTPPLLEENNDFENIDEVSEHLNSCTESIEHDRSLQEIEISSRPNDISNPVSNPLEPVDRIEPVSHENPHFDTSYHSDNSIISLNYLKNIEVGGNVRSILEEILHNEPTDSRKDATLCSSKDESLNIFANLDLDDKSLSNNRCNADVSLGEKNLYATNFGLAKAESELERRIRDFEELIAIKDSTIAVLNSELDSYRESNTNTMSNLSTTEYKQLQDDYHTKLSEYNNVIVYKNDLIEQLTESLDQSVTERKDLLSQISQFKEMIENLEDQLQKTRKIVEAHQCEISKQVTDGIDVAKQECSENENEQANLNYSFDEELLNLQKTLNTEQKDLLSELKIKFDRLLEQNKEFYEAEIKQLKDKLVNEKEHFESETTEFKSLFANHGSVSTDMVNLRSELEKKHSTEMEELRTYFEQKCADLEKNYSEEVFSQQSRKLSDSTSSEAELHSDPIFPLPPGPAGDIQYDIQPPNSQPNFTKKDIINLQNELSSILNKISKYNVHNLSDEEFSDLKTEIGNSNLNHIMKYDLVAIRNKYNAELEVLREDNENKVDELNIHYENKWKSLEKKYLNEILVLKMQLEEIGKQKLSVSSAVQEVGSSGEFEINEVIQSYERRLQEQITLAKIDIITALEGQIQRLASNEAEDEEWPSELLRLKDKFAEKYETEIQELKNSHQVEINQLKDEQMKILNGALERARRRSLRDNDSFSKGEIEILKERDSLKKQVSSLRNLLSELLKYFTQCEDELNNTLVDELLKQGFDKNVSQLEEDLAVTAPSPSSSSKNSDSMAMSVTRVHLTPNFGDLINMIEMGAQQSDDDSKDISVDLKNELGVCLEKLKQEANAILTLTTSMPRQSIAADPTIKTSSLEEKVTSLTRQLISETQSKERLREELEETSKYAESLEKEKDRLEEDLEDAIARGNAVEGDLMQARQKIAELIENGRQEIVSEGYGEEGTKMRGLDDTLSMLDELQEKARSMLAESRSTADPTLLHLIEELCSVGERIKEESKKDRHDLIQQIDVADKKYRTTQSFLEEQAMEREQERDESHRQLESLRAQLKDRDKDKASCERAANEVIGVCSRQIRCTSSQVEQLEHQLQELTKALAAETLYRKEVELERHEAVEKIKVLRDIIRELEYQTESKTQEVEEYLRAIEKLECIVDRQQRSQGEGISEDSSKGVSDVGELCRHIERLEGELQELRVKSELAGSEGALKQMRAQLLEIETQFDKKTRGLEVLHSTASTNCSSPSEDISARDLVIPRSPKKMEDSEVPLQQLARLKEKLMRHSRAEDAAIKRIKDLEMQVFSVKQELEETSGEKEYLKKQIQEQLVLISDFQIRLDEQRIRAEHIEKQTNTSLEMKIYDLQSEVQSLRDKLKHKDKAVSHQQELLSDTQNRLKSLENELNSVKDDEIIVAMQKEVEALRLENAQMKNKIDKDAGMVPNLVENIISDKNTDIEKLRCKLDDTEKLLEAFTSLNLDKTELQTISNLKKSGTSIEELFSILELSQADQMRRMAGRDVSDSLESPRFLVHRKNDGETTVLEPEISSIAGPAFQHSGIQTRNSTEISHRRVHFEDTEAQSWKSEIADLKEKLKEREAIIKEYEARLKLLNSLEVKIEKLQLSLEETEKALALVTETAEKEHQEIKDREKDLGIQLAEKKLKLSEAEKRIEILEQDSLRKDDMCLNLTKEKKDLEKQLNSVKHENFVAVDKVIKLKNQEIEALKAKCLNKNELTKLTQELEVKNMEVKSWQTENKTLSEKLEQVIGQCNELEEKLKATSNDNKKLTKEMDNKLVQIDSITIEINNLRDKLNKKRRIIRELQDTLDKHKNAKTRLEEETKHQKKMIADRDYEINIAKEEAERYCNDIALLEEQVINLKKGKFSELTEEKDGKIAELSKEKTHLMDLLNEKDKIINQITEDCHKLHANLVTIKSKIREPGNILDMGNKLREEQKRTAELVQEIHDLKAQLMRSKNNDMVNSVDEITDQLQQELNYSAQIDSNIINAVSDQSLSSIAELQDVEVYKKFLSFERSAKKQVEIQLSHAQDKIKELQSILVQERDILVQTQSEDAKLIEQLRIQLDVALDSEESFRKLLSEKAAEYEQLEKEVDSLKRKHTNSSESTEYKHPPTKEILELNQLRKDHFALLSEKETVLAEMASLKKGKLGAETAYNYTKNLLSLEVQRTKNFEEKIQSMVHIERDLKDSLLQKSHDIKKLECELEQERANFAKQKSDLMQQFKSQMTNEFPSKVLDSPVPDVLLDKIKELNNALLDNKKLLDIIQKLSKEKNSLEKELDAVRGNVRNEMPFDNLAARNDLLLAKALKLESTKKALIWQKRYLVEHLQFHHKHCLKQALPNALAHRTEFRRDYTLKQRFRSVAFLIISVIRMKYLVRRWHSGVRIVERVNARHYKTATPRPDPIISAHYQPEPIISAHYPIEAKSSAHYPSVPIVSAYYAPEPLFAGYARDSAHFRVGRPVSSQLFAGGVASSSRPAPFEAPRPASGRSFDETDDERAVGGAGEGGPWSGQSPPSKEGNFKIRIGSNVLKKEDLTPLRAPQLLAQFSERFDQIQEKLGMVLETNS
ncbi:unnamed protein product [Phaedon cochleariae]|uniref:Pericentrin/AKAP-450 centrosomal targeting domain-containing protein n=1 Tax=Phaedon cochleariae TaxID=80249 RepID=A0A9P0GP33_PHACE|nr:unnamed protein product [Phaedon cochleariae]